MDRWDFKRRDNVSIYLYGYNMCAYDQVNMYYYYYVIWYLNIHLKKKIKKLFNLHTKCKL